MIRLSNVNRLFRSDEVETTALRSINLDIGRGEFVAIMGPSGCGKTTLLNILGTIDRPTSGHYEFDGVQLTAMGNSELARFRRSRLGYVFQNYNLIDDLTIEENVALGLAYQRLDRQTRRERTGAAMDRVGIAHRARHFPSQLSGGQQQRAAIARAVIGEPALILADEPTGNLDTQNGAQVMDILTSLNASGTTIVIVTHSPSHADIARRRINMLDGRVALSVLEAALQA